MRYEMAVIDGPDIDLEGMDAWGNDGQTCRCVLSVGSIVMAGSVRAVDESKLSGSKAKSARVFLFCLVWIGI